MRKMNSILIKNTDKEILFNHLLQNPNQENMAIGFCGISKAKRKIKIVNIVKCARLQLRQVRTSAFTSGGHQGRLRVGAGGQARE